MTQFSDPPRPLGEQGFELWQALLLNYRPTDYADAELVYQVCAAVERADNCRRLIDAEGEVIRAQSGALKDHPLLRHELANRAFASRLLARILADAETEGDTRPGYLKRRDKFWGRKHGATS